MQAPAAAPERRRICTACANVARELRLKIRRGDGTPAEIRTWLGLLEQKPELGTTVHARLKDGGKVWVCPRHVDRRFIKKTRSGWQLDLDAEDAPTLPEVEVAHG